MPTFIYTYYMPLPKQNSSAPDFTLPDQDGKEHTLSNYKGQWVLLYFYPKDDTTGCTKEACAIRDEFPAFGKLKVKVLGLSIDSVKSHKKFAEKYELPFTLLADEGKKVVNQYGLWAKKKFMGREYMGTLRTSFLIDPKGAIAKIYENVKPETHADEVLKDLKELSN
jgi:thioredoxin-dependent peroxiredoxin